MKEKIARGDSIDLGRRNLIAGAGALALGSCLGRMSFAAESTARRQVMVAGKRVKTVDIHTHCTVDIANISKGTVLDRRRGNVGVGLPDSRITPDRIKIMDAEGIDVQALSINANWYAADRDLAKRLIDSQNAQLAEIPQAYPGRFVVMASVALQHPDLAAEQLETAFKKYGMRSCAIGGSVEGEELSAARFDPFWAKAQELEALVFIHPQSSDVVTGITKRVQGSGDLDNVIGNPLETTIALSHLIFEGTLDRFPNLRICAAHGGGYLPSYIARSDHGCLVFPTQCKGPVLKKKPSEYLRQLYFDSLVFTPEALRHLVAECGASQIMIGTDSPFPWTSTPVDHVMATPGLNNAQRVAILGGTACKLLGIPV